MFINFNMASKVLNDWIVLTHLHLVGVSMGRLRICSSTEKMPYSHMKLQNDTREHSLWPYIDRTKFLHIFLETIISANLRWSLSPFQKIKFYSCGPQIEVLTSPFIECIVPFTTFKWPYNCRVLTLIKYASEVPGMHHFGEVSVVSSGI